MKLYWIQQSAKIQTTVKKLNLLQQSYRDFLIRLTLLLFPMSGTLNQKRMTKANLSIINRLATMWMQNRIVYSITQLIFIGTIYSKSRNKTYCQNTPNWQSSSKFYSRYHLADVERGFSFNKVLLTDHRTNLSLESMK